MLGKGTHDPSLNPNAYPMTDTRAVSPAPCACAWPASPRASSTCPTIRPIIAASSPGTPSRGTSKLREAGSYGYLVQATIPRQRLRAAAAAKEIVIRLEVDAALPGGLAIYGERFGRYPLDPTIVMHVGR